MCAIVRSHRGATRWRGPGSVPGQPRRIVVCRVCLESARPEFAHGVHAPIACLECATRVCTQSVHTECAPKVCTQSVHQERIPKVHVTLRARAPTVPSACQHQPWPATDQISDSGGVLQGMMTPTSPCDSLPHRASGRSKRRLRRCRRIGNRRRWHGCRTRASTCHAQPRSWPAAAMRNAREAASPPATARARSAARPLRGNMTTPVPRRQIRRRRCQPNRWLHNNMRTSPLLFAQGSERSRLPQNTAHTTRHCCLLPPMFVRSPDLVAASCLRGKVARQAPKRQRTSCVQASVQGPTWGPSEAKYPRRSTSGQQG